ncbi:acyl carrier protein [Campylobacter sp. VicNov18]|uniref:acyl carrier protein n=1 Tax=Campylobacter bilis TaxID=2691918 RepID=UPI00130EE2C5|nr:acyl carrier protein [Campylobacter bilis]MPV64068.1 acyl carrier protein [Campylobacter hepaticus]MBM0637571.1 acyl carrier protein [Campylobacter bilis]MCC8278297.1 acyl carrier protein [Campylobacter bilis]MCC8299801.1 acyl carrier protein [Campylobacter bilis]MCC8301206.1 acyl carrier protein [Campylobacter bilis]
MIAYISIGTTNSGNQERQGFLMQNEDLLLQKGYIYPKSLRVANRHWVLVDIVLELVNKKILSLNPLEDLTNERLIKAIENFKIEASLHKDKKFIFSAEGIVWDFSTKKHIEILKSVLNALGFDEIYEIVYFRDTLGYLNSHCSQDIKNNMGFYSADFKPDEHPRKYIFDYKWICQSHVEVFGESSLIVRLLKEEYVGGTLLKDFVYHLGLEWDDNFSLKQNKNESFNLLGMELQGRLIKKDLHGQNMNSLLYIARKIFEGADEDRLKFRVQKDIAKAYVDYYASSLDWVRKKYFPHRKYLFEPIDWDNYKENPTLIHTKESDWDKVADFIAQIIISKNKIIQSLQD